jgi:hypothetical protein
MQRLVNWLTASPARALGGAVLCVLLGFTLVIPMSLPGALPGGFVVLLALKRGQPDWQAGVMAALTLAWLLLPLGAGPVPTALAAVALILPPLLVGRLLARGGSLTLAFQLSVLAVLVILGVVHLVLADPPGVWRPYVERIAAELDRFVTMMSTDGTGWHPSREELREAASIAVSWGAVGGILLANTMAAACLGLYAHGRATGTARLGPEFRTLKAGRTLAVAALGVAILPFIVHSGFATDAWPVFLCAFLLQGLALLHAAREILGFATGWVVLTYVLLFVPVTTVVVEATLAALGFVDNWLPLRGQLGALVARHKGRAG